MARLRACARGSVAIETAIILPFLCIAVLALTDLVRYVRASARLDRVVATTADLIARSDRVIDRTDFTSATLNNELGMFFLVANLAAEPDDLPADGAVIISSITPTGRTSFTRNWQRTATQYALRPNSRLEAIPPLPVGGGFIVAEVFLRFRSAILESLGLLPEDLALIYRRAVFRPRLSALTSLEPAP